MKSVGELSSTEELLEQIRNAPPPGSETAQSSSRLLPISKLASSFKSSFNFKSRIVVGVDIGYNDLKLIKVKQFSNKEDTVLALRRIPFGHDISLDSAPFNLLLKSSLAKIGAGSSKVEVWTTLPLFKVDRRYVRIPKVPADQIPDAVYWKYKKEIPFDDRDVIFDFEPLGDIEEDGKKQTAVMVFTALRKETEALTQRFSQCGVTLKGITIAPNAFQNLFRAHLLDPPENKVGILDIGMDKSRIDFFSNGDLVLSRDIKTSGNSLIEAVGNEISTERGQEHPETQTDSMPRELSERPAGIAFDDREKAYRIFFRKILNSPLIKEMEGDDLFDNDQLLRIISPVLDRLVWQVEVTSRHYAATFKTTAMEKIYLTGEFGNSETILRYLGNQLGLPSDKLDPFAFDLPFNRDVPVPDSTFEKSLYATTLGIALSNGSRTPNLILTRNDRTRQVKMGRINRAVYAAFIIFVATCIGYSYWQRQHILHKRAQVANLKLTIDNTRLNINKDVIVKKVARYTEQGRQLRELSGRYLGLAVLSELFELTPPRIRLINLIADLSNVRGGKKQSKAKTVVVDGVVTGNRQTLEASLAEYALRLTDSPIIKTSRIEKSGIEYLGEKEVLRFIARIKLVDHNKI